MSRPSPSTGTDASHAGVGLRPHGLLRARRAQRLPPAERHGAVAAAGDLPDPEDGPAARLQAHRPDHARQPGHRVAAAAGRRVLHRPSSAAAVAGRGHDVHVVRPRPARLGRRTSGPCWRPPRSSASARRSSTRSRRASRASRRAGSTGSRSRCSRWAGTRDRRSGRCWRRSWCCRAARAASPGSRRRRSLRSRCSGASAAGTAGRAPAASPRRAARGTRRTTG